VHLSRHHSCPNWNRMSEMFGSHLLELFKWVSDSRAPVQRRVILTKWSVLIGHEKYVLEPRFSSCASSNCTNCTNDYYFIYIVQSTGSQIDAAAASPFWEQITLAFHTFGIPSHFGSLKGLGSFKAVYWSTVLVRSPCHVTLKLKVFIWLFFFLQPQTTCSTFPFW
jgi:hypothetical protein